MELLHTTEEIIKYDNLQTLVIELNKLGKKHNNQELLNLADKYQGEIQTELNKYNNFIGIECTAPDSWVIKTGKRREGKIEGKFYFNAYSKSIRCDFRYSNKIGGGFDTHAIKDLIQIQES